MIRQLVINSFNVTVSHRGMANVFYILNLNYTILIYVLKNTNPIKQEKFKEDFAVLKNILKA